MSYVKSPHWTLLLEGEQLIASGGADALYLLDELDAARAKALEQAWREGALDALAGGPLGPVLEKLVQLGALWLARRPPQRPLAFALRGASPALQQKIALALEGAEGVRLLPPGDEARAELLVWVRAGGTLLQSLQGHEALRIPHLLVDLAHHHTVSLGPLVWPGETACLGCLAGRIQHGWGDPAPPLEPLASTHLALAAALLAEQVREFQASGTCPQLVERTLSLDLQSLQSRAERVHRLPWCPFCFPAGSSYGTGSFALPWKAAP